MGLGLILLLRIDLVMLRMDQRIYGKDFHAVRGANC